MRAVPPILLIKVDTVSGEGLLINGCADGTEHHLHNHFTGFDNAKIQGDGDYQSTGVW